MKFASDNRSGAIAEVLAALVDEASRSGGGYDDDPTTRRLGEQLGEVFEHDVHAYPVFTGTAANALALACLCRPWAGVVCHEDAHVLVDECGAPEFFGGGTRPVAVTGSHGRIDADSLRELILVAAPHGVHNTPLDALSLTNATEAGTVYTPSLTAELADVALSNGLALHVDGARLANAVVSTGATPAELTWRAGVDAVVFGATKNGALGVEVVVLFDSDRTDELEYRRKRAGHLGSKTRLLSAQVLALLDDDRWLRTAAAANRRAGELARLVTAAGFTILHPVEANMVHVSTTEAEAQRWEAAGVEFYRISHDGRCDVRLVTSFATTDAEIKGFAEVLEGRGRLQSDPPLPMN